MSNNGLAHFRKEGKQLIRALRSEEACAYLPAARRLYAAGVMKGASLMDVVRRRKSFVLKHAYETVAREAGVSGWPDLIKNDPLPAADSFRILNDAGRHLNLWFADLREAQRAKDVYGGRVVPVGATFALVSEEVATALHL